MSTIEKSDYIYYGDKHESLENEKGENNVLESSKLSDESDILPSR